jgi:hypothetical protein
MGAAAFSGSAATAKSLQQMPVMFGVSGLPDLSNQKAA